MLFNSNKEFELTHQLCMQKWGQLKNHQVVPQLRPRSNLYPQHGDTLSAVSPIPRIFCN